VSDENGQRETAVRRRGWTRIAAVMLATLSVVYLVRLGGLVAANHRAAETESRLAAEVAALETQVPAIDDLAETATADTAVEAWARTERNWARPGDHVVVPVTATVGAGTTSPSPRPGPGWWERFTRWVRGDG
jgi:hypothetical protein